MLTSQSKVVLLPSPVRDVAAFIFVLLALPLPLANGVLGFYFIAKAGPFWFRKVTQWMYTTLNGPSTDLSQFPWAGHRRSLKLSSLLGSETLVGAFLLSTLNLITVVLMYCWFSHNATNCIILFSKAIIASEIVGLTSVVSTTVTSITSVTSTTTNTTTTTTTTSFNGTTTSQNGVSTSNSSNQINPQHHHPPTFSFNGTSQYENSNLTGEEINSPPANNNNSSSSQTMTTTTTTSPKKAISHENSLRNSRFINALVCVMLILNLNYFLNHLNPGVKILDHFGIKQKLNFWDLSTIIYHQRTFKSGKSGSFSILDLLYLSLCAHVILTNLLPLVTKQFDLQPSRALDSLNNIASNVPSYKRNNRPNPAHHISLVNNSSMTSLTSHHSHNHGGHGISNSILSSSSSSIIGNSSLSLVTSGEQAVINVEQSEKLTQIPINDDIAESFIGFNPDVNPKFTVVGHNFEAFCATPSFIATPKVLTLFDGQNVGLNLSSTIEKASSNSGPILSTNSQTNLSIPSTSRSKNRLRLGTVSSSNSSGNPNSTTIMNKKFISEFTVQPFWSFIAAIKVLLLAPQFFAGKTTQWKNNGGRFNNSLPESSRISLAITYIDDGKVIYKVLQSLKWERMVNHGYKMAVKLNNVDWYHVKYYTLKNEHYICIYGLTPLFQYELELFVVPPTESDDFKRELDENEFLISHYIFNTISSLMTGVLNQSPETLSLMTLQLSLTSTLDKLNGEKLKMKKHKKEEHRKITEVKKEIEILKGKIQKYGNSSSTSETRVSGKLKGLKHAVIQLEQEIEILRSELNQSEKILNQKEPALEEEESMFEQKIVQLKKDIDETESEINHTKNQLKQLKNEEYQQVSKSDRLEAKRLLRNEELSKILQDIKNIKKLEMLQKSSKRNKRFQERYEVVLPKLSEATAELQKELKDLVGNESNWAH